MLKQDCLQIGTLVKTHGIHGELILEAINPDLIENIKESVFLEIEGLLVPFFIASITKQSKERFRVQFEWTDSETAAKKITHAKVYILSSSVDIIDEDYLESPSLLSNFLVIDKKHGELGVLVEIIENTENPLMVISKDKTELLIPFHTDFIKKVKSRKKTILIETPEGLIDLYL